MTIELILAIAALALAAYAFKLVKDIKPPAKPAPVIVLDTYTREETDDQIKGLQDSIDHLQTRVYELREECLATPEG